MSSHGRKVAERERVAPPVLPTACFLRHGYDLEEGPHSPADVDLLEREGKADNGLPVRRVRSGVRRLFQDGRISGAELAACERWAADYGLGVHGASDPQRRGSSCRGDIHSFRVACLDAATRHREAAKAIGPRGDYLLTAFVFEGRGLAAVARMLAAAETPEPGQGASKGVRKEYEGAIARRAQPYTQRIAKDLIEAIQTLTEFYEDRSADKRQDSWWRPVDPETGRTILRNKMTRVQAVTRPAFAQPVSTNHQ